MSKPQLIFISGRFRSGTSMLWNLFNQLPGYCAWYEPLHSELISNIQMVKPKADHVGIDDYWQTYRAHKEFQSYYRNYFGYRDLYLSPQQSAPELKAYIDQLITLSGEHVPVLQFNRMDLRLGWLRSHYPESCIINIYRDPISLWHSSRKHIDDAEQRSNESYPDAYDLMQWSADLARHFPMLQPEDMRNGFYRHYFIYRLSNLMAEAYANHRFKLEKDVFESEVLLQQLGDLLKLDDSTVEMLSATIKLPKMPIETSAQQLAEHSEYQKIQVEIDDTMKATGIQDFFPSAPPQQLKSLNQSEWSNYTYDPERCITELLQVSSWQKIALTHAQHKNKQLKESVETNDCTEKQ